MKIEELITLAQAGYTKEEISQLLATATPTETPKEPEKKEKESQPEKPATAGNEEVIKRLDTLLAAVQHSNIINSQNETTKAETIDDVLAAIINPQKVKN